MKIKPIKNKIVVRLLEEEDKKGNIIIPETAKGKTKESVKGVVVAVGPGEPLKSGKIKEMKIKEGDVIVFGKFVGVEIEIEDKEYRILRENVVLGKIEN